MKSIGVLLIITVITAMATCVNAQDAVIVFQNRTATPGAQDITLTVKGYWSSSLISMTIPVVVREIDPGAFWTGDLPADTAGGTPVGVAWNWAAPWAFLIQEFRPGVPTGLCDPQGDLGYDGISPDHFVIVAAGAGTSAPPEPDGREFLTLTFDVTETVGRFEFDTACFSNSMGFLYLNIWPLCDPLECPTFFTKGIVTICGCAGLGDCNGDAAINPVDVIYMVNAVYKGGPPPPPIPDCPAVNGDWNCDNVINPVDVAEIVNFVYRNSNIPPCNPCAGGKLPDLSVTQDDVVITVNTPYEAGDPAWLGMRVRNLGRETAYAPEVSIYEGDPDAGGTLLGSGTLANILPGGVSDYYYFGIYHFEAPGAIGIYGVADFSDAINETNEDNNRAFKILEVVP